MQFYIRISVQNQNAQKLMKIHNKYKKSGSGGSAEACFSSIAGLYQTFPSDSQDQAPDRKIQSKIYSNIKQKLEDTKDTSQTSELLHHFKSGSSDLHPRPGVSQEDSSSLGGKEISTGGHYMTPTQTIHYWVI